MLETTLELTKIVPVRSIVSSYDLLNNRGYFCDTFQENIDRIDSKPAVAAYRHLAVDTDPVEALHFYAAHVVYNYVCNIDDQFRLLIDNDEIVLTLKSDGVYYRYLSNEDAEECGDIYWEFEGLTSDDDEVSF